MTFTEPPPPSVAWRSTFPSPQSGNVRDPGRETGNRPPYATGLAQCIIKNQVIKPINRVNWAPGFQSLLQCLYSSSSHAPQALVITTECHRSIRARSTCRSMQSTLPHTLLAFYEKACVGEYIATRNFFCSPILSFYCWFSAFGHFLLTALACAKLQVSSVVEFLLLKMKTCNDILHKSSTPFLEFGIHRCSSAIYFKITWCSHDCGEPCEEVHPLNA